MIFVAPWFLLLLIPAAAGLWLSYRHIHGMAPFRKRVAFAIRFLLAACLIVALAGPEARLKNQGTATVFLVDRSDSISQSDRQREERFVDDAVRRLKEGDQAGVVLFGADAKLESTVSGARILPPFTGVVRTTGTDIAGAVRLGSALFPDGKARRLVLISDANETLGDAAGAADVAALEKVPIDVIPLGGDEARPEAAIDTVQAPSEASADRPYELRVVVDSTVEQRARITLERDDLPLKTVDAQLHKGKTAVVIQDSVSDPGFHRYRAVLEAPEDSDPRNNVGLAFVSVRGKPKLLVLQESLKDQALVGALQRAGIAVDTRGPGQVPTRLDEIQGYDAIFLNDFNADHLLPNQMEMLRSAAQDSGIGLGMVGGENSFLPGGYYGTPIADALPVDLNVKQRKSYDSASIAIIGDVSGSMGIQEDGMPKVRIMAKAAEETVKMLDSRQRIGVAGSAMGVEWVAPMQSAANKEDVIAQIQKLDLGGAGIFAHMTIVEAKRVLEGETSKIRHFIMMADGNDVKAQEDCEPLIAEMRAENITTTCVAIGDGKDVGFLRRIAALGGGRFYLADHADKLPSIVTQDTSLAARSAIEEGAFLPKLIEGSDILQGIDSTPPLLAYDLTDVRPLAREEMKTAKDDPLMATWEYGLGTTFAFTSDAQARWAASWVGWSGFSTLWGQVAQSITRRAAVNSYQIAVIADQGKAQVSIKAADKLGNPLTSPTLSVRVGDPDGQSSMLTLTPQAPGEYAGQFDADKLGSYLVSVVEPGMNGRNRVETAGFSQPYPAELRAFRTNTALLERIRQTTGGRVLNSPMDLAVPPKEAGESLTELWVFLLAAALCLLPLDIANRRLALPFAELWASTKKWAKGLRHRQPKRASVPAPARVSRLREAKERASAPAARPVPPKPVGESPTPPSAPSAPSTPPTLEREPVGAAKSAGDRLLEAKRRRDQGS